MNNSWVEVDLSAILYNISCIKKITSSKILAVVKADAYGHGAIEVAKAIKDRVDMLGVFSIDEGIALRNKGIKKPILILGPSQASCAKDIINYELTPAVFTEEMLEALSSKAKKPINIHIKIDTGMWRIGVPYKDAPLFIEKAIAYPNIKVRGIFSHLATSYLKDKSYAKEQFERFSYVLKSLSQKKINIPMRHIAASAGILDLSQMHLDMVRPGILLYGLFPSKEVEKKFLPKEAMSFKTRIAFLRKIPKGSGISYGQIYITDKEATIAVIPVGYSHGLRRALSNKGYVLIRGKRAKMVGTICMDMTMIDVSDIPDASIGDEVVIFGKQGEGFISIDELADACNTINYEIITGINPSLSRIYKK
ncbi:MAG: alanine racemase [bacterium]